MSTVNQAIILAAGEGRRLAPVTDHLPKALVPFYGRPLLDWALSAVLRAGVTRIAVNAFHLADAIEAHLERLRPQIASRYPGVDLHLSREPALLGTGGAVRHLRHWLTPGEPFLVVNADTVFADPLTNLCAATAPALLVTTSTARHYERNLSISVRGVTGISAQSQGDATFCGVTLADPGLPSRLPDGPSCILRQGFMPFLGPAPDGLVLHAVTTDRFFADTGLPERLIEAHLEGTEMLKLGPPFA